MNHFVGTLKSREDFVRYQEMMRDAGFRPIKDDKGVGNQYWKFGFRASYTGAGSVFIDHYTHNMQNKISTDRYESVEELEKEFKQNKWLKAK